MENVQDNIFELLVSDISKLTVMQKQETFHSFKEDIDRVFEGFDNDFYVKTPLLPELNSNLTCESKGDQRHITAKQNLKRGTQVLACDPICLLVEKQHI